MQDDLHIVTGGTGFIGSALILELLQRTSARVVALVRPDERGATRRLHEELILEIFLWKNVSFSLDEENFPADDAERKQYGLGPLAERYAEVLGRDLTPGEQDKERTRFSRAPVVIGVVSVPRDNPKIPQWEMFLSAGAAAMNLLHAAHALGFGANWITNWYADDAKACAMLGLAPGERAVGFVHIGTPQGEGPDRPRPDVPAILSEYSGPRGEG